MQYWINQDGVQSGPVELDGLKDMNLTSRAFVWHEGLDDWAKITQLPELQGFYEMVEEPAAMSQPMTEPVESTPVVEQPQQPVTPYPNQSTGQPQYASPQPALPTEPCPPTNLVWAVISTVLCCIPAGIVAIVYATKVQSKYNAGDLEGAKRASETSAWWCIAAIVLGLMAMPLSLLLSGLTQ